MFVVTGKMKDEKTFQILFVDAEGLLRVATALNDGNGVQQVRRWSRMLRHR